MMFQLNYDADGSWPRVWFVSALVPACVLWAYRATLVELARRWSSDPRYSHGWLVPVFALAWLGARRGTSGRSLSGSSGARWLGVVILAGSAGLRLVGVRCYVNWLEAAALLPALAGTALLLGGWSAFRWAGPSIGFLVFMIPLPYRLEIALGGPLQRAATWCSTSALQTLGLPAVAEGNTIALEHSRIGVVEACNGLGMLFTFLALTTAAALVVRRPPADKALIVLSAIPISFIANVARITATGYLRETVGERVAAAVYHDLSGWLMMPAALAMLWAEVRVLDCLFLRRRCMNP